MPGNDERGAALASCSGYRVEASDGVVGEVDTPLFPPDRSEPDYLILRAGNPLGALRPVIAAALVDEVDALDRRVRVRGTRADIESLPGNLPLAQGASGEAPPAMRQPAAPTATAHGTSGRRRRPRRRRAG